MLSLPGKKKFGSLIDLGDLQESPHAPGSFCRRNVPSAKGSADRNSTGADIQPSLASDSWYRWGFPLFSADGIFGSQGHQEEVNVTDIAGAKSSYLSSQQRVMWLKAEEARGCHEDCAKSRSQLIRAQDKHIWG